MPQDTIDIPITNQPETSGLEISDLIGKPPGWLLRSGIGMVALVVVIILACTTIINYPDKIEASGTLTSTSPPIELVAPSSGYITEIMAVSNDTVAAMTPLLYMRSTTDHTQVELLREWIGRYEAIADIRDYLNLSYPSNLQLGSAQGVSSRLESAYGNLRQTLGNDLVWQQLAGLKREIGHLRQLGESQRRALDLYLQELDLVDYDHQRQTKLHQDGVISTIDHELSAAKLLQAKRQAESIKNNIIQNDLSIHAQQQEVIRLKRDRQTSVHQLHLQVNELIANTKQEMLQWKEQYSIPAPVSGHIQYLQDIVVERPIQAGQTIGHIIPVGDAGYHIAARCPVANAGKMEVGQRALIRFPAYPAKEYGTVKATVSHLQPLPTASNDQEPAYDITVNLPDTITTDYGLTIPYRPQMMAQVTIIMEDRSLFDRVFDQLTSLLKANKPPPSPLTD